MVYCRRKAFNVIKQAKQKAALAQKHTMCPAAQRRLYVTPKSHQPLHCILQQPCKRGQGKPKLFFAQLFLTIFPAHNPRA